MYKVLVVDDEMLARVGIKSLIPWEQEGFTIVGEADNGEKALEEIYKLHPDIIITDYKMPIMDGIELLLRCKKEQIPSPFIVLSAYSDYEYVRSTLKNGAVDYLLKLELEPEGLLQALHKAVEQICEAQTAAAPPPAAGVPESGLRHAYRQLINGCSPAQAKACRAVISQAGSMPSGPLALAAFHILSAEKSELTAAQFGDTVGPVVNVIGDIVGSYAPAVTLSLHRDGIICTVFQCGDDVACVNIVTAMALRVRETVKYLFNYSTFIGCSLVKRGTEQLGEAWGEAADSMHRAELYNMDVCVAAALGSSGTGAATAEKLLERIGRAAENLDYGALQGAFRDICAYILDEKGADPQYLCGVCCLLVFQLGSLKRRMGFAETEIIEGQQLLQRQLRTLSGQESAIRFVRNVNMEFKKLMDGDREYPSIARAKAYVEEHLAGDISLEDVAEYVSLSANYFSKLFHRRTGQKFTAYITDKKVKAAKALLLSGNKNVGEIAAELGFENTTYFSKVFKKATGVTPQAYQQGQRGGDGEAQ
ncbi:response regulator transcription factor [Enterocloster lavalensis]|uniref:response regulator transcription factor n=1 Tax=Enterocloster lavalensis TaxID=460384 RepID=UPI0026652449|nr:response regulator [Enterocloster lavalensis]